MCLRRLRAIIGTKIKKQRYGIMIYTAVISEL